MKTIWKAIGGAVIGATGLLLATRNGFLIKAVGKNLTGKPFTPSIDDAEQFDFHEVPNAVPKLWAFDPEYNHRELPQSILKNLEETKASSLLIIRKGKILHEAYWNRHHSASLMNSFSMAKGILAVLVGAAIDEGKIESEDQLFSDFYPEYAEDEFGKHLTLKHLLQMQAALDWAEEYHHPFAPNSRQYFVEDLEKQVFDRKLKEMPGIKYEYQSAAPQLLGFALRKAVGTDLATYLSEKIWKPLGMEHSGKWSVDSKGMEKAFCCIHGTPRDFAKIGQLIMNDGEFDGKQIISKDYFQRMKEPSKPNDAFGYTIWVNNDCSIQHHFLYGFLGQFVVMIPEKDLIIVKTGHDNNLPVDDKLRPLQVSFLAEELCKVFA